MVKHVVLFKFKEFETNEQKLQQLKIAKEALENLIAEIDVLKSIEVGINVNSNEAFDLSLTCTFDHYEEIVIYANHVAHVRVAKETIVPYKVDRACVDYII